jgi:hypothetical protein
MKLESVKIADLSFDSENARIHPTDNQEAIRRSLETFGQRKPIVVSSVNTVVAGNGTMQAALDLGWETITVVRIPEDWSEDQIRAFAIADNKTTDMSKFDVAVLKSQLQDLHVSEFDIDMLGFSVDELDSLGEVSAVAGSVSDSDWDDEDDDLPVGREVGGEYTSKIMIPQYEVVGDQPGLDDLVNDQKAELLREQVRSSEIPDDVKDFLLMAANRHTVFNYKKVAEYYPHASPEVQRLMEESALVIIDVDDAIALGYAKFSERMMELQAQDGYDYA